MQIKNYTSSPFLIIITAFLLLTGCNKKLINIFDRNNNRLEVNEASFDYLSSKAKIHYESARQKNSVSANIRISKDSVIWISLSPGLGIEAARALVTKNSISFIDKVNKVYSNYDYPGLSRQLGFNIGYDLIESVIVGNLLYPYGQEKVLKTNDSYSYGQQYGRFFFQNYIDVKTMKLKKVQVTDTLTKNTVSVNYDDLRLVAEEAFPFLIQVKLEYPGLEGKSIKVDIEYKQTAIEEKPLKFPYNIPQRYGRK